MKRFITISVFSVFLTVLFTQFASAQFTANTNAAAQIVEILIIEPISGTAGELNFGTAGVENNGGTILLSPDNSRLASGDVVLFSGPLPANAAGFQVSGTPGSNYTVTLPATPIVLSNGSFLMQATTFTTSLSGNIGTISGSGSSMFTVGGTLLVSGNQPVAVYEGSLNIAVNYN